MEQENCETDWNKQRQEEKIGQEDSEADGNE